MPASGFLGMPGKSCSTFDHSGSGNMDRDDVYYDRPQSNDATTEETKPIPVITTQFRTNKVSNNGHNRKNVTVVKRSNKLIQALDLPTIMNVNTRSIYNKAEEFHIFVEENLVDLIFMSESWERPEKPLEEIINLPNHVVISNPHQRQGVGGRPALMINTITRVFLILHFVYKLPESGTCNY